MRAPEQARNRLAKIVGVTVFALVWFAGLGARDLLHPDEGRYAEIPREMVASGDWITPRLDGFKYFEKPPLQYWATAAGYELFGESNATARLWTSLTGFLVVLWIAFVGTRVFGGRVGEFSALFLGSSLLWIAMGHILTLDMGFSAFLALSLGAFLIAQSDRDDRAACRRWMLLAWIAIAGAILTKGPVALVLAGGSLAIYGIWQRDRELVRHLHLAPGLSLMLLATVPWFAVVSARNPGFAEFFFVHEHLSRYATSVAGRNHPWWMFLPVVVLGAMPWMATAIRALVRPGFGVGSLPRAFDPVRFLWVWCAFTVVFFSCSHSKLIPYVLPAFPALALLAGKRIAGTGSIRGDSIGAAGFGLVILAIALAPGLVASRNVSAAVIEASRGFALGASACLVAGGVAAAFLPLASIRSATVLSVSALLASLCLGEGFRRIPAPVASRRVAEAIRSAVPGDAPVYCVEHYDQPLPFYLGRTVDLVHERAEFDFGLSEEPGREIPEVAAFIRVWEGLAQGAAILPRPLWKTMEESGVPMRRIYEDARCVVIARR